jgi:molybdopterin adenylyltransferase
MTAAVRGKAGKAGAGTGTIVSVNISPKKGQTKTPVARAEIIRGEGLRDDAHRLFGHRQVSLLMLESIEAQKARLGANARVEIGPGAFAENLTTRGIDLTGLKIGDELVVHGRGGTVRLKVTQIGKECHTKCAVYHLTGECIMPGLGIFCEVLEGGTVRAGDPIEKR